MSELQPRGPIPGLPVELQNLQKISREKNIHETYMPLKHEECMQKGNAEGWTGMGSGQAAATCSRAAAETRDSGHQDASRPATAHHQSISGGVQQRLSCSGAEQGC